MDAIPHKKRKLLDILKNKFQLLTKQFAFQRRCIESVVSFDNYLDSYFKNIFNGQCLNKENYSNSIDGKKEKIYERYQQFRNLFNRLRKQCNKMELKKRPIHEIYNCMYRLFDDIDKTMPVGQEVEQSNKEIDEKMAKKNSIKKIYVCPNLQCAKEYIKRNIYIRHVQAHLKNEPVNWLENKNDKTKEKPTITFNYKLKNADIKRTDNANRQYECSFDGCVYRTKFKSAMEIHRNKHSTERPYQCEVCGKTFKQVYALRMHAMGHQNQRFHCPYEGCDAVYSWFYTLKKHIRIHNNQAKVHRCDWPGCDYQAYRLDLLRKHRPRHTDERKYKCKWPECAKAFKTESGLFDHIRIHKNERKYSCTWPGCNYRCNLAGNLRKHITTHEKKLIKITNASSNDNAANDDTILHQTMLIDNQDNVNMLAPSLG